MVITAAFTAKEGASQKSRDLHGGLCQKRTGESIFYVYFSSEVWGGYRVAGQFFYYINFCVFFSSSFFP